MKRAVAALIVIGALTGIIALKAKKPAHPTPESRNDFWYTFNTEGVLEETDSAESSPSPYWWLNSGGRLIISQGIGMTIQGELPFGDRWQFMYALSNPADTDRGYHPQNLFRLITKHYWENIIQETYFRMDHDNHSNSPNKNESNGLLLFSRYEDEDNLYYAGLRVDGNAVIKKKVNGKYCVLGMKPYGPIPRNGWVGIRSRTQTMEHDMVRVTLSIKSGNETEWQPVLDAIDTGTQCGRALTGTAGHAGIRTDFMDVSFRDYRIQSI
jgi:hypothetical protein